MQFVKERSKTAGCGKHTLHNDKTGFSLFYNSLVSQGEKKKQKKVAYTSDENFNVAFNKNKQTTTTKKKQKKKRSSAVLHFVIQNNTHVHSLYCFVDYPLFFFSFHQPLFVSHLR